MCVLECIMCIGVNITCIGVRTWHHARHTCTWTHHARRIMCVWTGVDTMHVTLSTWTHKRSIVIITHFLGVLLSRRHPFVLKFWALFLTPTSLKSVDRQVCLSVCVSLPV